jgi:hypothetical protein
MGLHYGSKVKNNEVINIPNPVKAIEEKKAQKEIKEQQNEIRQIWDNIENYDGSNKGQKKITKEV